MAQSVQNLLCVYEDLNITKARCIPVIPAMERRRQVDPWGSLAPASLAHLASPVRYPIVKK